MKIKLNQHCQCRGLEFPKYTIVSRDGPAHNPIFTVECRVQECIATSKPSPTLKLAENHAASLVWKKLNGETSESESEDKREQPVTVFIDGDNVHEILDWAVQQHPPVQNIYFFVTRGTVVRNVHKDVKVIRSKSSSRDATDVAMIIYLTRYLPLMAEDETLILVSRDKIFQTLQLEIGDERVKVAQTIAELTTLL